MRRSRLAYAAVVLIVIVAGLASRKYPQLLPAALGKYPGDALWALTVFLVAGLSMPRWRSEAIAAAALLASFCVESSQLYQAPWINSIREAPLGHLLLGSTFNWHDLTAYTIGIAAGYLAEKACYRRKLSGGPT